MPVKPILVANDISVYKAEVGDEGILLPLPSASKCGSMLCVLTSLPMQRCCIPTLFSHLWWRLILQALQRRPCFAVFPARNTTCLAVVPETSRKKKRKNGSRSRQELDFNPLWPKLQFTPTKRDGGNGKYYSELHRLWNNLANVTRDTHFCEALFDQTACNWAVSNTWNQANPLQMCSASRLFFYYYDVSAAAAGINVEFLDWLVSRKIRNVTSAEKSPRPQVCGRRWPVEKDVTTE